MIKYRWRTISHLKFMDALELKLKSQANSFREMCERCCCSRCCRVVMVDIHRPPSLPPLSSLCQIPEYCRVLEESEISEHCFDLIFAFDEIVALGYRENVNLAQIRTFTEMDSHEEKVFRAVREVRAPRRAEPFDHSGSDWSLLYN